MERRIPGIGGLLAALVLSSACACGADLIVVRNHDKIVLKSNEVLVGLIVQNDKAQRKIWIKLEGKAIRTPVPYDSIKEILPSQNLQQAYQAAKKKMGKQNLSGRLALARECIRKKLVDEAIADLTELTKDYAGSYDARHGLIAALIGAGKPAEAMKAAREAVEAIGADDLRINIDYGRALIELRKYKEAEEAFAKAGPTPGAKVGKGLTYLAMGRAEDALELFGTILGDDPKNLEALIGAGNASLAMANAAKAAEFFGRAASVDRSSAEPLIGMGSALYLDRSFDTAGAVLNEALNLAPRSSEAYCVLGLVNLMKGDHTVAAEKLMEAVREKPTNGRAHVGLGVIFRELGEEEAALDSFRRAAKAAESDAFCRSVYAGALLGAGELEEALSEYKAAAALAPEFPDAVLAVGAASILTKNYAEGVRWYEKAVKLAPQNPHAHSGLGIAYLGQGNPEQANVSLRRALMIDEHDPQALLGLAYIANNELRENEALGYLQQVLNRQPDNEYAIRSLKGIYGNRNEEMEYHSFSVQELPSGWMQKQSFGVRLKIDGGVLNFEGRQRGARQGQTFIQREVDAGKFLRFGAEITPVVESQFEGGLFLKCARGSIQVVRSPAGRVAFRYRDRNGVQPWAELADWHIGASERLQILLTDRDKLEFKVVAGTTESKPFVVDTFLTSGRYYAGVYTAAELNIDIQMKVDNLFVVKKEK